MIKKVDISEFGSFKMFNWKANMGEFAQRNIIYGRNYSGKTTLSRVFQCIERGRMHDDFTSGDFQFEIGTDYINESHLPVDTANIRVYNSDFKRENLSILHDKNGEVRPFAIIGEKNINVEKQLSNNRKEIKGAEEKIGDIEEKKGISWNHSNLEKQLNKSRNKLSEKLRHKAGDIRSDFYLFKRTEEKKTYNINDFEKEIDSADKLSESDKEKYRAMIKEEPKDFISVDFPSEDVFLKLRNKTIALLEKEVKPSKAIKELSEDSVLQSWVKEGIDLHKNKRDNCGFCGNPLDNELWKAFDAHFTQESEKYNDELKDLAKMIEGEIDRINAYEFGKKEDFYTKFHGEYNKVVDDWNKVKKIYIDNLKILQKSVVSQQNSMFDNVILPEDRLVDISSNYKEVIRNYQQLIDGNNEYTNKLDKEQSYAREKLRFDFIYNTLEVIDYKETIKGIKDLNAEVVMKKRELDTAQKKLNTLKVKESSLSAQLNDQKAAVKQVNFYLKNQLGHNELELKAVERENDKLSSEKFEFQILRSGELAYNLSEGEQSLISFSYFLATLKDIESPEEWIIFIDDPISSLDGNNIFYIYSLINSEIAKVKYKQIFISTHNLDLLKYLHRLEKPTTNGDKWKSNYFMIEKKVNGSQIIKMPEYLRKYSTEFIYLFNEIYTVGNEEENDENISSFYNFPNNARKFLESYLFFKLPDSTIGRNRRLEYFFDDITQVSFLQRINNEYSHADEQPDRTHKPIDIAELKKDALIILDKIQAEDSLQYKSLCRSIGKSVDGSKETEVEVH